MFDGGFLSSHQIRRLPVYLLLDCSTSMSGEPIEAVSDGLQLIHQELSNNPRALETAQLSVITFASQSTALVPLTTISRFQPPRLHADGWTAMASAFQLLADSLEHDLTPNTPDRHGDFRPIVFLLTDGHPTDPPEEVSAAIQRLHAFHDNKRPMIIALGCEGGPDGVDTKMLHQLTTNVFLMKNVSGNTIRQYFEWISSSITQASQTATSAPGQPVTINPPTDIPGLVYDPGEPR